MCFSATASFGASLVLGGLGGVALIKAKHPPQKVLALTPILFAIQQFIEGWLWLSLDNSDTIGSGNTIPILTSLFLIFAWIIWPIFIPYFCRLLESEKSKRRLLKRLLMLGTFISISLLVILLMSDISAVIEKDHISYRRTNPLPGILMLSVMYILVLLVPFFISSIKELRILGCLNLIGLLVAGFFFRNYLISTWCFFAAISSIYILYIVVQLEKYKKTHRQLKEATLSSDL